MDSKNYKENNVCCQICLGNTEFSKASLLQELLGPWAILCAWAPECTASTDPTLPLLFPSESCRNLVALNGAALMFNLTESKMV